MVLPYEIHVSKANTKAHCIVAACTLHVLLLTSAHIYYLLQQVVSDFNFYIPLFVPFQVCICAGIWSSSDVEQRSQPEIRSINSLGTRKIYRIITQRCFTVGARGSSEVFVTMALQQKSRSLMNLSRATGFATSPRHARNKVFKHLLLITYSSVHKYFFPRSYSEEKTAQQHLWWVYTMMI